jgi:hypothetical protein
MKNTSFLLKRTTSPVACGDDLFPPSSERFPTSDEDFFYPNAGKYFLRIRMTNYLLVWISCFPFMRTYFILKKITTSSL